MADEGESSTWSFRWPTKIAAFFRPDWEEKTLQTAGFCFIGAGNLSVVVQRLHTAGNGRSDERGRIVGERTETLWDFATVWTPVWYTGAAEGCESLDPSPVIGIPRLWLAWYTVAWCRVSTEWRLHYAKSKEMNFPMPLHRKHCKEGDSPRFSWMLFYFYYYL